MSKLFSPYSGYFGEKKNDNDDMNFINKDNNDKRTIIEIARSYNLC